MTASRDQKDTAYARRYRANVGVHGLGRRPSRADRTPVDPELLAEFNAGTARAIAEYAVCPDTLHKRRCK